MSARARVGGPVGLALALAWASAIPAARPAAAQTTDARGAEAQALRLAGQLESQSHYVDAENVLRRLLDAQPGSTAGLFALDRVMHAQGRPLGALSYARRYLESDPTSEGVRFLELRLLAEGDSLDASARALEAWIARVPGDPAPYREAAPLWEKLFGPERALELLERGRKAVGDPSLLALQIGDLLHRTGRTAEAATEWADAADVAGNGDEIVRRVGRIDDRAVRTRTADALIGALERAPSTPNRRMLAVHLAITFAMFDRGLALARSLEADLPRGGRRAFLEDVTRYADDAGAAAIGLWALGEQRKLAASYEDARQLDSRITRGALAAGDTATAIAAWKRLAEGLPNGSAERRRALADRLRVEVARADGDALIAELEDLRREYPDAPETDELAALIAEGLQSRGQPERAAEVIARVDGPKSSLERAYMLLAAGDVAGGRTALMGSIPGLTPARATDVIQLSSLLGKVSPQGAAAVASAAVEAHRGHGRSAAAALERAAAALPEPDRPMVLAETARLFDGTMGGEPDAARVRAVLVERYVDAPESAEAALDLARWHARTPDGRAAAVKLLEDLIVRAPESAVAPAARRELERLRKGA